MTLSQWQLLKCFLILRFLLSDTILTRKFTSRSLVMRDMKKDRHGKMFNLAAVHFKQNVRCIKFRMMRAVDFGALCIHDN